MGIFQGISAAKRILPIIDSKPIDRNSDKNLNFVDGNIVFNEVSFKYEKNEQEILNKISLNINSGEMTALVGIVVQENLQ